MMRSERAKFLFGETVRTFRKWRYYGLLLMLSVAFGSVMMLVMLDLFSREMSMVDAQFVQPERIIRYAWCDSAFDAAFDALDDDGIAAKSQFYTRDEWVMSPAESRVLRVSHVDDAYLALAGQDLVADAVALDEAYLSVFAVQEGGHADHRRAGVPRDRAARLAGHGAAGAHPAQGQRNPAGRAVDAVRFAGVGRENPRRCAARRGKSAERTRDFWQRAGDSDGDDSLRVPGRSEPRRAGQTAGESAIVHHFRPPDFPVRHLADDEHGAVLRQPDGARMGNAAPVLRDVHQQGDFLLRYADVRVRGRAACVGLLPLFFRAIGSGFYVPQGSAAALLEMLPLLALLSLVMTRAALCPKPLVQQLSGA